MVASEKRWLRDSRRRSIRPKTGSWRSARREGRKITNERVRLKSRQSNRGRTLSVYPMSLMRPLKSI